MKDYLFNTFEFTIGDGLDVIMSIQDGFDIIDFSGTGFTFSELILANNATGSATITYGVDAGGNSVDQITSMVLTFR